jgi:hypothetical protein
LELVSATLANLPSLVDLKINLTTQNEAFLILNNLVNLHYLNGKSTRDETHIVDIEDKEIESISLNNEISNFNAIFTKVSEKLKQVNKDLNKTFFEEFQELLKSEIANINTAVDTTVPNYIYATNVLSSKVKIFKYFSSRYCNYQDLKEVDSSKISREIVDNVVKASENLISTYGYNIDIIYKLYPKIDEKTDNLRRQLDEALKAAQVVDNQIDGFGDKMIQANKERDFIIKQHQEEKLLLLEKIDRLEKENTLMTERVLKNAKDIISNNTTSRDKGYDQKMEYNKDKNESVISYHNESMIAKSKVTTSGPSKILTAKMLKEIIDEIYESKVTFDKRCYENKMPRETMEQHMYTYLNHKYGLKNLIIEWATSIINGIKTYSAEDSDICLFGKVCNI